MALLLLPFLLTALVPQGFMPSVQADGAFTVTLCTTDGLRTVTLDASGEEIPDPSEHDEDGSSALEHCVFAGIGAFLDAPQATVIGARRDDAVVSVSAHHGIWLPATIAGSLGARAPPHGA
jgi:hypothetical protein